MQFLSVLFNYRILRTKEYPMVGLVLFGVNYFLKYVFGGCCT